MKSKKERIPLGVRQEFDDIDYWNKLKKSDETFTLEDGTVLSAYDYMKKFMHEAYGKGFYKAEEGQGILQTQEQKSWAIRNNNNTNRDALNVARKTNRLSNSEFLLERGAKSEPEAWEQTLKNGTYQDGLDHLLEMAASELKIELTKESKRVILKLYFRITKLMRYMRKDKKNKIKQCKTCNQAKAVQEFYRHNSTKDGYQHVCKQCRRGK